MIKKINDYEWEIPKQDRPDMRQPVRLFATEPMINAARQDKSLDQAANVATLPGLAGPVMVMPDMHQGYGFPIGGVAATRVSDGVVSPGGIGYDINCGVRLLASSIEMEAVRGQLSDLATALDRFCPSGVGSKGSVHLSERDLEEICRKGVAWATKRGWAGADDIRRTEEEGCINGGSLDTVSKRAGERGREQLGTLGAGNHFVEVDWVEEIFDDAAAQAMGLNLGCLTLQIHTGSRGFGHQVCTDYVQSLQRAVQKYGIQLPDRELVCAPIDSDEGRAYLSAMAAAANYAFVNRQLIANEAREAFEAVFAGKMKNWHLHQVYDIAHNVGKLETHIINGEKVRVCVHRKGATRAFGPGSPELPDEYRRIGQPVLVPGSMGTGSWVLAGNEASLARSWGSSCHGAGRVMSRAKAKTSLHGEELRRELQAQGIFVRAGSMPGLAEEAPGAYKDVDEVVETVVAAGIVRKVARLRPLCVVKG
ncbi:MAG TPA: RtcB family protein [Anaerolineaceae bacterium]|nr:RtcB family protein [Anaerolineaceae bacterium]HPN50765.1 RtcB family protein [Anaerolineaceae bacterium]